uniref:NADP-dependent oxidoreductase domain-containing protein n=1 Tax=Ditylum brightwellii TaxID=49249 RepID=A0A6U3QDN9_9STRA
MTIGGQTNKTDAATMIQDFGENPKWINITNSQPMLDSAIMYQNGKTEKVIGSLLSDEQRGKLSIATKANAFTPDKDLSPSGVRLQLEESLKSLQQDSVDLFYLHAPDAQNHIEPTLEEVQKMYKEGKFQRFGLSNFTAWEVVYIHSYMSARDGYVLPSIYQGMYNAITRQIETELLPALHKLGMGFFAYNPLCGGMLSGKYTLPSEDMDAGEAAGKVAGANSRFAGNNIWAKRYRERYHQKQQFEALDIVREALQNDGTGIGLADASLRWIRHHSKLRENDGIIFGASKVSHYEANMTSLVCGGPLPDLIVKAFNDANKICKDVCPNYARGYSGSSLS